VFTSADPITALGRVVPQAVSNVFIAVGTLLASSPTVNVVVATVPKVSVLPEVKSAIEAGFLPQALADGVDFAIGAFNQQIRTLAASNPRVALADVDQLVIDIFAPSEFRFGDVMIDRESASNEPTSLFLADGIHAGTVGQGLLANVFANAANAEFETRIRPLSEREILCNAGIRPQHLHSRSTDKSSHSLTCFGCREADKQRRRRLCEWFDETRHERKHFTR
jgi:hypothetical protein